MKTKLSLLLFVLFCTNIFSHQYEMCMSVQNPNGTLANKNVRLYYANDLITPLYSVYSDKTFSDNNTVYNILSDVLPSTGAIPVSWPPLSTFTEYVIRIDNRCATLLIPDDIIGDEFNADFYIIYNGTDFITQHHPTDREITLGPTTDWIDNPILASIFGPDNLAFKQTGLFVADVSGGTGSYSYEWRRRNVGFTSWNWILSTQSSVLLGQSESADFEIQLKVTSGALIKYAYKTVYFDGLPKIGKDEEEGILLDVYSLEQNYPNPFNPNTRINYSLPVSARINIKVYDLLGREVRELVNEQKEAGYYTVNFNASNLNSGIYFYRITAQESEKIIFSESKRMILIK